MNKKETRKHFKSVVFNRDNHRCVFCGNIAMDAHHITDRHLMPNGGYVLENGISLCSDHHIMCEQFHITNGEKWFENKHPNDLYEKIGSSYKLAYEKSLLKYPKKL
jgi:5-methylcytosine-specific restriction endonuclease McrA